MFPHVAWLKARELQDETGEVVKLQTSVKKTSPGNLREDIRANVVHVRLLRAVPLVFAGGTFSLRVMLLLLIISWYNMLGRFWWMVIAWALMSRIVWWVSTDNGLSRHTHSVSLCLSMAWHVLKFLCQETSQVLWRAPWQWQESGVIFVAESQRTVEVKKNSKKINGVTQISREQYSLPYQTLQNR